MGAGRFVTCCAREVGTPHIRVVSPLGTMVGIGKPDEGLQGKVVSFNMQIGMEA